MISQLDFCSIHCPHLLLRSPLSSILIHYFLDLFFFSSDVYRLAWIWDTHYCFIAYFSVNTFKEFIFDQWYPQFNRMEFIRTKKKATETEKKKKKTNQKQMSERWRKKTCKLNSFYGLRALNFGSGILITIFLNVTKAKFRRWLCLSTIHTFAEGKNRLLIWCCFWIESIVCCFVCSFYV